MAATKTPNTPLKTNPPTETKEWSVGAGEKKVREWRGTPAEISEKYELEKANAEAGNGVEFLSYKNQLGRATLMQRFTRVGGGVEGIAEDVIVTEELYAVDVVIDMHSSPYFAVDVDIDKWLPLNDNAVAFVLLCVENRFTEAEITLYAQEKALGAGSQWENWTIGMKELRFHLLHGKTSYYETGFILRRSLQGVRTSLVKASFLGINKVCDDTKPDTRQPVPEFKTQMDLLIDALPIGEWLYRPPTAESLGRGKWRIGVEYHWAEAWSIAYGGTFNL